MKIRLTIVVFLLSLPLWANDMEDAYQAVRQSFDMREKNAQQQLRTYLQDYPYTTYYSEVQMMIGVTQVEKKKYKNALKSFAKVKYKELDRPDQPVFFFSRGYAFMMQQDYKAAAACFKVLKDSDNPYTQQGKYYYAYCYYVEGDYKKALPEFLALENTSQYRHIVPYYIIQIDYANEQYDEVQSRAQKLLAENPDNENNAEIYRILGETAYTQGDYKQTAEYLTIYDKAYREKGKTVLREDEYMLAMAKYQQKEYAEAITAFKRVKQEKDSISESVCLYLGHCYRQTNNLEKAKLSYAAAMRFGLNKTLQEEAAFNYTLSTYESSTALGESVTAFNDFLQTYPNSVYRETIYHLLADAYMSSKNYKAALEAVEAIQNPDTKLIATKQYLRYQIGVDAFVQGRMQDTEKYMTLLIEDKPSEYSNDALYYRAEARYRLRNYEGCYNDLKAYKGEQPAAVYLLGYTLFNMHQYAEAEEAFQRYIANADRTSPLYADALNRLGDCCFNNRAFKEAEQYYKQVVDLKTAGTDYALFQRGYVLGLLRRYDEKAETMEQLVASYPKSDYADDALYEIARAQLQNDKNVEAIDAYTRLMSKYPNSNLSRKASLEKGMIYRNLGQNEEAISALRYTVENYPGSEEAYTALDNLEQLYVQTNNISEYLAYLKKQPNMKGHSTTEADSLTYTAAELQYMLGNYEAALAGLMTYIQNYCTGGRYCAAATNYVADCHYRLGDTKEALYYYEQIASQSNNPYLLDAVTRAAELSYDLKNYETALTYFTRLQQLATKPQERRAAQIGVLRCNSFLNRSDAVIAAATALLEDEDITTEEREEALYNRGKMYFEGKSYGLAIVDLTPLAQDVRVATGAEAKYLLAEAYFQLGALDNAETEIMSFTQQKTQHQYWLARALVLLSDINVKRGELFQARQYLLSLQQNYKATDDIQAIVAARLAELDRLETPTTNEEEEETL